MINGQVSVDLAELRGCHGDSRSREVSEGRGFEEESGVASLEGGEETAGDVFELLEQCRRHCDDVFLDRVCRSRTVVRAKTNVHKMVFDQELRGHSCRLDLRAIVGTG